MEQTTIDYIVDYFSRFMTKHEAAAAKHYSTSYKYEHRATGTDPIAYQWMLDKGWLSNDPMVLALLQDGYESFKKNTAERILRDHPDEIHFNNCPQCGKLARTAQARQCRFCGYDWH